MSGSNETCETSYLFSSHFAPILVRNAAARKWSVVALGLALLCGLPVIASALPVSVPALTASQLRGRILASAGESYAGYAESNATFGLPSLAGLADLTSLLDGVTRMRVWQAAPDRWRVDVLSDAGERDTYQLGARTYIWASGQELLTEVLGQPSPRLPRPADLVPPALALRLLAEAGRGARYSVIAPLRVAGQSAAGLRMTPADPASTVGQVDIWAEPASGLPLMVEIFGRGSRTPALESQFFSVDRWPPQAQVLTPVRGPGTGFNVTSAGGRNGRPHRRPADQRGHRPPGGLLPHLPDRRNGQRPCAGTGRGRAGDGPGSIAVITTRELTKRYGSVCAVRSVDLDVRAGDRYGLLGPNGSGKTTLVRMLLGLVYATSGQIEVMSQRIPRHVREVLPQIGALIEEPAARSRPTPWACASASAWPAR
jgi:ABC-type multidrug transport system fused ATPase/permease subunit